MISYIVSINTYKREVGLVIRCIRAALGQKYPPVKVILIDQNEEAVSLPEDITSSEIFERKNVLYKSVSASRNCLEIPGEAEWIFFCDDDGYADKEYSARLNEIIENNPQLEIIAGSIVREDNKKYYSLRHKKRVSLSKFRNTKNLMGSNFAVKKETFNKLSRFDEKFGVGSYWGSSEETDFCWKAYFAGVPMEYFPELIVYHVPPFNESIKGGSLKAFRYGIGKGALVQKWLIRKKKLKVIYELLEMLIIPFVQVIRGIFIFKPQLAVTNMAGLAGRIYGFVKAFFVK